MYVFLVQTLVGRAISIKDAGRYYLSAELTKMGVRHLFPNECVFELADVAPALVERRQRRQEFRTLPDTRNCINSDFI